MRDQKRSRPKLGKCPPMHDANRKREQALHAAGVVIHRRMPCIRHERAVVYGVAGEEHTGRRLPQRDGPGRLSGNVEDLEVAVAEVNGVAVLDEPGCGRGQDFVPLRLEFTRGQRAEHFGRRIGLDENGIPVRFFQVAGFARMHRALTELMVRADMVEVGVRGDSEQGALGHAPDLLAETRETRTRIDEEVPIPSLDEADVAAVERNDVRLLDVRDPVVEGPHLVPVLRSFDAHHRSGSRSLSAQDSLLRAAVSDYRR